MVPLNTRHELRGAPMSDNIRAKWKALAKKAIAWVEKVLKPMRPEVVGFGWRLAEQILVWATLHAIGLK